MQEECVLCDGLLDDEFGHNAMPLAEGRCCTHCNETVVIPYRIALILDIATSGR